MGFVVATQANLLLLAYRHIVQARHARHFTSSCGCFNLSDSGHSHLCKLHQTALSVKLAAQVFADLNYSACRDVVVPR